MAKKTIKKELTGAQDLYNFLFEACNIIRGPVSQDNFKDYITPLLYYKRISDVYDEETEDALSDSGGDKEMRNMLRYLSSIDSLFRMAVIGRKYANAARILVLQSLELCDRLRLQIQIRYMVFCLCSLLRNGQIKQF